MYVLIYASKESIQIFQDLKELIEEYFPDKFLYFNAHGQKDGFSQNFYIDFNPTTSYHLGSKEKSPLNYESLYQSDQDYLYKRFDENYFINKTNYTLLKLRKILEQNSIKGLFSVGGGSLFTNCFFEVLSSRSIPTFRFPTLSYLNQNSGSPRFVFFESNQYLVEQKQKSDLPTWAIDLAISYYESVKNKKLLPDRDARKVSKSGMFTPNSIFVWSKYLIKYMIKTALNKMGYSYSTFEDLLKIKTYINKLFLKYKLLFQDIEIDKKPFFLMILHHPIDSQLAFRGRQFRDQIALARTIAMNLPYTHNLLIKEHPVYPGMIDHSDVSLLVKNNKVKYLTDRFSFSELIKKCDGVITINSTAGLEAMIHEVPIFVLGNCFYSQLESVYKVDNFENLLVQFNQCLNNPKRTSRDDVINLLASLFELSHPKDSKDRNQSDIPEIIFEGIQERVNKIEK